MIKEFKCNYLRLAFMGIIVIFFSCQLIAQENTWTQLKNMQTVRGVTSACAIAGKLYVVGSGNKTEEYDPALNSWRYLKDMPITRKGCGATVLNDLMYVTGGQKAYGEPGQPSMHRYNPTVDVWDSTAAAMPFEQYILPVTACSGKIYAGCSLYHPHDFAVYDPIENAWAVIENTPSLECTALCGYDGALYAFGGAQELNKVYSYDPSLKIWGQKADMPTGRMGAVACYSNGLIYVIGGTQDPTYPWEAEQIVGAVEAYDPVRDVWHTDFEAMKTPRYFAGADVIESVIYVVGGKSKDGNNSIIEAYAPFTTGIEAKEESAPKEFVLDQNYPNPFNPATTIEYMLPCNALVTLKIYNLLGKEILTLVNEQHSAGSHSVVFEARDLPSGVYLYSVQAEDFNETRKMLLVR
jgi:hypothetical protein